MKQELKLGSPVAPTFLISSLLSAAPSSNNMGRKTKKRPPPRKEYRHLGPKPTAYDCLVCYRENEVDVRLRSDRVADIRCSSCDSWFRVELAGACTDEQDAYHVWVDIMDEEELDRARERMTMAACRGLDITVLSETSFLSSSCINRRVP